MKIAAFLTAAALACGTAFAAAPADSSKTTTMKADKTTTAKTEESNGSVDRAVAKTKAVVKRAGVKVRETGKRIANATRKATTSDRDDTSRMGASGTNKADEKAKDKAAIQRKNKVEDQRKN